MKVFVTGGAGQVGSHVAELLLLQGDSVLALDNFETGRPEHLPTSSNFRFVEGSIADKSAVEKLLEEFRPDVIVHTAASYKNPDDWHADLLTNALGGVNLIKAAVAQ